MKKGIILFLAAILILGNACTKDFLSVNEENPNNASSVPSKYILPAAINRVVRTTNNPRRGEFVYLWYGLWCISPGYAQNKNLTQYDLTNSLYINLWSELYLGGSNFDFIIKQSKTTKDNNYLAIAKIMNAYIFQTLVDVYGDVPYTDAFKADQGILKPKFDKQQEVYEKLVVELDDAIKKIQEAPVDANNPGNFDPVFKGNMTLWLKFANTLKLRILVNQSGMAGRDSYIKSNIASTASVGYLGAGEGAFCNPGYLSSEGKMNPFWETFYKADGTNQSDGVTYYAAGADAVDFMATNNDPRLNKFFKPMSNGKTLGIVYGDQNPPADVSKIGPGLLSKYDQPSVIMSDFEALFLQAEAIERGYITGSAKDLYDAAVTRSFIRMGNTATEAAAYITQDNIKVNYSVAPDKLNLILTQKWLALNGQSPFVIWTDVRRTGMPTFIRWSLDPGKKNATPPVRLYYPSTEVSVNLVNLQAVGEINLFSSKIFWQNR